MAAAESLAPWLRLTLAPGVGGETQRRLLKAVGLPEAIFAAGLKALAEVVGVAAAERLLAFDGAAEIEAAVTWAASPGNRILTLADADYPQALLECADPPTLIYLKGHASLLNERCLAIVGSRNPTPQGEANATAFAAELAAAGLTIVSGLALGIDAAAHRGALRAGGHTIAVVGTGADRIYPARNRELAHTIGEKGAILSEFPLGTPPLAGNFPRRNRLIAGLSRGCLVVEAAAQSGSLITARLAAESGREVFAIPGSIHSPLSKGCHQLIRQGAKLVESARDVLEELSWPVLPAPLQAAAAAPEDNALLSALGQDPCTIDALAARAGLTPDALLAMLLQLELEGHVASLPGGRYQRLN
ncbi:MAG TPA: DNA-processing protein DprA [Rhodocyclaceae bacterium]|nr:DNA-processing protein DprA [Rhodocyclaceae bacterium]